MKGKMIFSNEVHGNGACYHRLIKHLQQLVADIERPEPLQESTAGLDLSCRRPLCW